MDSTFAAAHGRTIVLHLGNGASMCAIDNGRSVATTMGFTAADGLPMGTRCGSLDPCAILYFLDELKMDARAIEKLIYQESGLLGVSGISQRYAHAGGEPGTRCTRCDRPVRLPDRPRAGFAGGCARRVGCRRVYRGHRGEQCGSAGARVPGRAWLGIELDAAANAAGGPRISTASSRASAWVIPANEELTIARHTWRLLDQAGG